MSAPIRMKVLLQAAARVDLSQLSDKPPSEWDTPTLAQVLEQHGAIIDNFRDLLEEKEQEWQPGGLLWRVEDFGSDSGWPAVLLLKQVDDMLSMDAQVAKQYLIWASKLHEIGVSIAHSGYHKHSAYILENADMPGFSKMQQQTLGLLVRAQRRALNKLNLPVVADDISMLILILRLAILFHRNRLDDDYPQLDLYWGPNGFDLHLEPGWLQHNPLTQAELDNEVQYWKEIGISLMLS